MHVFVDDREPRNSVAEYLKNFEDTSVEYKRLLAGDYLVNNQLLFERKTLKDFAISLVDGRLFNQACHLSSTSYLPIFILEGSPQDLKEINVRREAIQGAILSLAIQFGIPLVRSASPEETAYLISYAAIQEKRIKTETLIRNGYRPKRRYKRQLFILQGLPGVGPKLARRLLETFGTIQNVFKASEEELASVLGIGTKRANEIFLLVTHTHA